MAPLALYIFALLPVHLAWWYRHFLLNFTTFWVIFLTCMGWDFSLCYFALSCPAHVAWLACSSRPALLICWGGGASSELSYTLLSSSNSEKFIHLLVSELCSIIKLLWPGSGQSVKSLFIIIDASASPCATNVKQLSVSLNIASSTLWAKRCNPLLITFHRHKNYRHINIFPYLICSQHLT